MPPARPPYGRSLCNLMAKRFEKTAGFRGFLSNNGNDTGVGRQDSAEEVKCNDEPKSGVAETPAS